MNPAELREFVDRLGERNGCCLHIVTEDFNLRDSAVHFCIGWAQEHGHPACEAAAREMLKMSVEERAAFLGFDGYDREDDE